LLLSFLAEYDNCFNIKFLDASISKLGVLGVDCCARGVCGDVTVDGNVPIKRNCCAPCEGNSCLPCTCGVS
jgi:hypothetical protein